MAKLILVTVLCAVSLAAASSAEDYNRANLAIQDALATQNAASLHVLSGMGRALSIGRKLVPGNDLPELIRELDNDQLAIVDDVNRYVSFKHAGVIVDRMVKLFVNSVPLEEEDKNGITSVFNTIMEFLKKQNEVAVITEFENFRANALKLQKIVKEK